MSFNINVFDKVKDDSQGVKKKLNNEIKELMKIALKQTLRGKLSKITVDSLEKKFTQYYSKFPNEKDEKHSKMRIEQLRTFVKLEE